jgi:hypothetical protein
MKKTAWNRIGLAMGITCTAVTALSLFGCASMFGGGSSTSSQAASSGPYRGEVTFQNASSAAVCRLEVREKDQRWSMLDVELGPQGTTTFTIDADLQSICVIGCVDTGVLYGMPPGQGSRGCTIEPLAQARIELHDEGDGATTDADRLVLSAHAVPMDAWIDALVTALVPAPSDAMNEMRHEGLTALRAYADSRRYPESFLAARVVSSDWSIVRHRATGMVTGRTALGLAFTRFAHSDDHCQAHTVGFVEPHDGSDFVEPVAANGLGGAVHVPCSVAEHAATRPDFAH